MPCVCYHQPERGMYGKTRALIGQMNRIINAVDAKGYRLTARSLYYKLVGEGLIPNTEKSYRATFLGALKKGRLQGLIDWALIHDEQRPFIEPDTWTNPEEFLADVARAYRTDLWAGQNYRVEAWCEKTAKVDVLAKACQPFGVPYYATKGHDSLSNSWRAAERFKRHHEAGQHPVVLYVGDHDPSGMQIPEVLAERFADVFKVDVTIVRVALNFDQALDLGLPPNPVKVRQTIAPAYRAKYGDQAWELDATDEDWLHDEIVQAITRYMDQDKFNQSVEAERAGRERLRRVASQI